MWAGGKASNWRRIPPLPKFPRLCCLSFTIASPRLKYLTDTRYPSLQGCTVLGAPARVESVGETEVPHSLFLDYVIALGDSTFGPAKFDRRSHNSNAFCKEVTQFLCGKQFPLGVDEEKV